MSSLEIREKQLKAPIDVAEYLFRRLRQVGIQSVHGVPGMCNFLDLHCYLLTTNAILR